jgi:hypothetical protein
MICRTFYAYRVYVVSKRKILIPTIIIVLSLASLGCALGAAVTVFTKKYFARFAEYTWGVSTYVSYLCSRVDFDHQKLKIVFSCVLQLASHVRILSYFPI